MLFGDPTTSVLTASERASRWKYLVDKRTYNLVQPNFDKYCNRGPNDDSNLNNAYHTNYSSGSATTNIDDCNHQSRDNDDNDDESDSYDPFDCSDIVIPTVKQVADRVLKKGLNQRKDLNSRKLIRTANMTTTSDGDDESCDDLNNKPNDSNTNNGDNNDSIENSSNANNKMVSVNGNNSDDATLCTSSNNKHTNHVVARKKRKDSSYRLPDNFDYRCEHSPLPHNNNDDVGDRVVSLNGMVGETLDYKSELWNIFNHFVPTFNL
eukprot:CAMPEP_0194422510 /NCGR_PEP_ID=MMETSP0176-20130528/21803_1 /TAXON_ID=216777 /ORGANISM="Proboscia alata, Strain PI-D3" /LENGTH=264 /DNA_ID=CAMNT_0039231269 /DNA_START=96 /DNA_END=887 /DNA_ORIENTATION=+